MAALTVAEDSFSPGRLGEVNIVPHGQVIKRQQAIQGKMSYLKCVLCSHGRWVDIQLAEFAMSAIRHVDCETVLTS